MKKLILVSLLFLFGAFTTLNAHAPKKLTANYTAETGILKVKITHPVKNVTSHYISELTISVNGEEAKVLEYTKQSSKASHDVEIELPGIEKNSEIDLKAKCSKFGSKSATYIVK